MLPRPKAQNGERTESGVRAKGVISVPCTYAPLPSMRELKQEFSARVNEIYDGRPWTKYSLRVDDPEVPGEQLMTAHTFEEQVDHEAAIAWGLRNGLLPAMGHNELLDYYRSGAPIELPVIALGSYASDNRGGPRRIGVLGVHDGMPYLDGRWSYDGPNEECAFLFILRRRVE